MAAVNNEGGSRLEVPMTLARRATTGPNKPDDSRQTKVNDISNASSRIPTMLLRKKHVFRGASVHPTGPGVLAGVLTRERIRGEIRVPDEI